MRIASYNINSVRLRITRVIDLLKQQNLDILCLQETKCEDKDFPQDEFIKNGYYVYFSGQKSYNGVCIISRFELSDVNSISFVKDDKRHICGTMPNGIIIHNFYIPAGGDEPDISINPKFAHKLDYIDEVTQYFSSNHKRDDKIIIMGDFNIAPYEHDVWSHKQLLKVVSHTPIEVERLEKMRESVDFIDIARQFIDNEQKLYSWWSYRNRDWQKSNRGRRLDHIWATPVLKDEITNFEIISELRNGEKPSDHVPVIIDIK